MVSTRMEFMMRASFMVASALASGIITADAHTHNKTENNDAAYASTHIFQMPKKRMDGSGKSGKASWMEFRNRECIGLGIFFSTLSGAAVRVQCAGEFQFCLGDLFDPDCDHAGPPRFYLCKDGECVEQRAPAKP